MLAALALALAVAGTALLRRRGLLGGNGYEDPFGGDSWMELPDLPLQPFDRLKRAAVVVRRAVDQHDQLFWQEQADRQKVIDIYRTYGSGGHGDLERNRRMSDLMTRIESAKRKRAELASRIPVLQSFVYDEAMRLERSIGREVGAGRLSPEMWDKVRSQLRNIALLTPRPRRV